LGDESSNVEKVVSFRCPLINQGWGRKVTHEEEECIYTIRAMKKLKETTSLFDNIRCTQT
jgi:hypothetical protein